MASTGPSVAESSSLQPYSPALDLRRLAVGVDNLRFDVFLSPGWCEQAGQYIFEQILHHAQPILRELYPAEPRSRTVALAEFRRRTSQLLQDSLNQAKERDNIQLDLLARLAVLKFLGGELSRQFSQLVVACKERADKKAPSRMDESMDAFVLRSKVADFQVERRHILRAVGETLFQLLDEIEESSLRPSRAALFGSDHADIYKVLRSRLLFLENPNDAVIRLEHYVMLGHFQTDPDREDRILELLAELLREHGLAIPAGDEVAQLEQNRDKAVDSLHELGRRVREAERDLEGASQGGGRSLGLGWLSGRRRSESPPSPADMQQMIKVLEATRKDLVGQVEGLEANIAFHRQSQETRISEALSNPANAERLFGGLTATGAAAPRTPVQDALLRQLYTRFERAGVLPYLLAGYLLKPVYKEFCPPLNPQQLKHALIDRHGWDELETLLDRFPTRDFPLEALEDAAKRLRHLTRSETETLLVRFARDVMRLRRDALHRQLLTGTLEKVNLVVDEKTRQVSRLNGTLYEFVLEAEREAREERVVTHVVVKADVRDSSRITEDLLRRGLNPATHFSLNFYEPVRKVLDRFSASKIFIEGDAIILGIYETEANRAQHRPVAKACLLAKEIISVCQAYNERARANDLPVLELGAGVAFQNSPPHYWADGDTRILISAALNTSDRLSSCTRMARRLLASRGGLFRVYGFQGAPAAAGLEEEEEFLFRYNVMGVALNAEGFEKLRAEISLTRTTVQDEIWGEKEEAVLYHGTVPLGQSFEKLILREARVPRLRLPAVKVEEWTPRLYYEVCVSPQLYEQFSPAPNESAD